MFLPKALLIDVDRTITNLNREVTPATQEALKKIQNKIPVGLSTGRNYAQLKNLVMQYMAEGAEHIVSGGGEIVTTDGQVVWSKIIPDQVVKKIANESERIGSIFGFGKGQSFYASQGFFNNYAKKTSWQVDYKSAEEIADWSVALLIVINVDQTFLKFLDSIEEISYKKMISYQNQPYVDITAKGINKGTAAETWAERSGIELSQIAMIGDSENDLDIAQKVGYSVAMGNSIAQLKESADLIIGDTNDDGLAKYIMNVYNYL